LRVFDPSIRDNGSSDPEVQKTITAAAGFPQTEVQSPLAAVDFTSAPGTDSVAQVRRWCPTELAVKAAAFCAGNIGDPLRAVPAVHHTRVRFKKARR